MYIRTPQSILLLSIFAGILLFAGCKSGDSSVVEKIDHYASGEMSRKYSEVNGVKDGKMIEYYMSGKLKEELKFKNGIQVDTATKYYENGVRKEVQYFKDGKVHGGDTTFYEDGKPQMTVQFTNGLKDGYLRSYGEDGSLTYEAKFKLDTIVEVKGVPMLRDTSNHQVTQSPESLEKGLKEKLEKENKK